MKLYDMLKSNNYLRRIVKKIKIKKEYKYDVKLFSKYYNDSGIDYINAYEYKILLLVHSLEKGMCHTKLRLFGEEKVNDLIELLTKYLKVQEDLSTTFKMGYNIIVKWISLYDENNWKDSNVYNKAIEFISTYKFDFEDINVGSVLYSKPDTKNFDNISFLKSRHSVRCFKKEPINDSDVEIAIEAALLTPTACNRQMCKIYYISDENKKNILEKKIMGLSGFDKDTVNYFVVTFDIAAFSFYGERNQGYLNCGLVSTNFVNELHNLNIGSCFLQWGNTTKDEENIKKVLEIPDNERIGIIIGAGYYTDKSVVPCSQRKSVSEIYKKI